MTYDLEPAKPHRDRWPAIALFTGGLLSGAALVVLVLALSGAIGGTAGAAAQTPAPSYGGQLVTPPPIAAPEILTSTALADGHALGASDAPVTIEIWADYQCPYCAQFSTQVEPQIVSTYVETGQARLVFRDLAFLGEESRWAAVAARLAEQQDAFWPFHDYLFANQLGENVGSFSVDRLREMAGRIGLDQAAFDAGLELDAARRTFAQIRAEFQTDAARLGIRSTPSVVVEGTLLAANDWATIRAAVDQALGR